MLRIPKLRQNGYFPAFLEARSGSKKALVAEPWIGGVSALPHCHRPRHFPPARRRSPTAKTRTPLGCRSAALRSAPADCTPGTSPHSPKPG
jgi:hypothetical protein